MRKWSVLPFVAAAFISSSFCRNKALLKEPRRQPAEPARSLFNAFFLVLRAKCPDVSCGILSPERRIYSIFEVPRFICGELGIGGPRGYETVGWTLGHRTGFSPTLFTPSRRRNGFLLPSWFVPYPARSAPIITFHIPTTQLCGAPVDYWYRNKITNLSWICPKNVITLSLSTLYPEFFVTLSYFCLTVQGLS